MRLVAGGAAVEAHLRADPSFLLRLPSREPVEADMFVKILDRIGVEENWENNKAYLTKRFGGEGLQKNLSSLLCFLLVEFFFLNLSTATASHGLRMPDRR